MYVAGCVCTPRFWKQSLVERQIEVNNQWGMFLNGNSFNITIDAPVDVITFAMLFNTSG